METDVKSDSGGGAPAARGGAGAYIEGELGAFYLLAMLSGNEARGAPGSRIACVSFQGVEEGFALDDLIIHGISSVGETLLEVQSKRTVKFSPKDTVFKDICYQIAKVSTRPSVPDERHLMAVATQRTSYQISGPYQDVLEWARAVASSAAFFKRISAKGVASPEMRGFVKTFRANLASAGVQDDDEVIWKILRRFRILEFDFESGAPQARTHALFVARHVLSPEDGPRIEGLWSTLIELSLASAKVGGSLDRETLRQHLVERGFRLAANRDFAAARTKLEEMSRHALAEIGQTVSGIHLPRRGVVAALDKARDSHRFVELRGGPGVGKSAILRQLAERVLCDSRAVVLDPVGTPDGGWSAMAARLGVTTTAREFLSDLAISGGAVLFIDSLEMFVDASRRRTVNDLLREVSEISGFSVVITARTDFGAEGDNWLAQDALEALGQTQRVEVGEIDDAEVSILCGQAPELRALLSPNHPAAPIARNLYRLSRLLKVNDTADIRTEAALAAHWWATGDGIDKRDLRPAQRMLADLAEASLTGRESLYVREDSNARTHLLRLFTLSEERRRDHLAFYHDVLRDWAVGMLLHESPDILDGLELNRPVPGNIARGVEFAGRLALEREADSDKWLSLLERLSQARVHDSWRRNVLMAIVRSELAPRLLEQNSDLLLKKGARLFRDLCDLTVAMDTVRTADLFHSPGEQGKVLNQAEVPRSLRTAVTAASARLLRWCVIHASDIPIQAIGSVVKLGEAQFPFNLWGDEFSNSVAKMLYGWLRALERRETANKFTSDPDAETLGSDQRRRLVDQLRTLCLLMAAHAPEVTKSYLKSIGPQETEKVKAIRAFSKLLAAVAPEELADLIERSLIEPARTGRSHQTYLDGPISFRDSDYLPPSPAQPPFLNLLDAAPEVGLALIRRLTKYVIEFAADGAERGTNGYQLMFEAGPRFFPWANTYLWSRDQAREYSVASGLMALEAWGHSRLDAGEPVNSVIKDILGPEGSCAAYLLVAVDLLISHWPATREALVPFVSCPALLASERGRAVRDQTNVSAYLLRDEPSGRVRLEDLRGRPSRRVPLERLLSAYLDDDETSRLVRERLQAALEELGAYSEHADFGDPSFMGAYALNVLNPANWVAVEDGRAYRSPPEEAEHLKRLMSSNSEWMRSSDIEAKVSLATSDRKHGSVEIAREALLHAAGDLPDDTDTDYLKSRSTRLVATAMLVAREGDEALLDEHEQWVRNVLERALSEKVDGASSSRDTIAFNRPALATNALIHLWCRRRNIEDRNALVAIAGREDRCGALAFGEAIDEVIAADPRLAKSALRVAFANCLWRWNAYGEDPAEAETFASKKAAANEFAVSAEIAWLDGGHEPIWPSFPHEEPAIRRGIRIPMSRPSRVEGDGVDDTKIKTTIAVVHADTQAAAAWLKAICAPQKSEINAWLPEIVGSYARWTAVANGLGYSSDTDFDHLPSEWNQEFYHITGPVLLGASEETFDQLVCMIEELPDQSFCRIAESLLYAADVWYFNDSRRSADRPVHFRQRMVQRATKLRRWDRMTRPGDLNVDTEMGPLVAKLFMNNYNPFSGTKSYLVAGVFDRIDLLLDVLRPLLAGGPTAFIALCVMNTLKVLPRPRHTEFFISAVEAWLGRMPADLAMWIELGIGRRVVEWLEAVSNEDAALFNRDHPLRVRVDSAIGRLVSLGVAEAYEFERRIERDQEFGSNSR